MGKKETADKRMRGHAGIEKEARYGFLKSNKGKIRKQFPANEFDL